MARIKPEEIIDDLSSEFKSALAESVREVIPNAQFDEYQLFRAFQRAVSRRCRTWERVRNSHVKVD